MSPEEHSRFTVDTGTSCGMPAASAAARDTYSGEGGWHVPLSSISLRGRTLGVHRLTDADVIYLGRVKLGLRKGGLAVWLASSNENLALAAITLNSPCNSSSTGVSFHCPFFARPIGVRFAKVMTTSSGCFAKMAGRPRGMVVEAARIAKGRMNLERETRDIVDIWLTVTPDGFEPVQELYNSIRINRSRILTRVRFARICVGATDLK